MTAEEMRLQKRKDGGKFNSLYVVDLSVIKPIVGCRQHVNKFENVAMSHDQGQSIILYPN